MQPINCKTQPKLTNVENCPGQCPNGCNNGFCDCATGQCMCNPGYSGSGCTIDTCAAAGCVNGNCASRYLGGDLLVTQNPCVCIEGWYGPKCDSNLKPIEPEVVTLCLSGSYFFIDTDIEGGNIAVNFNANKPKDCAEVCNSNSQCNSWSSVEGVCYLKTGLHRIQSDGVVAGIKCSAINGPITNPPVTSPTTPSTNCNGKCPGSYPYGCNSGFSYGYCSIGGGCAYDPMPANVPNWCCFKGCDYTATTTTTSISPATTQVTTTHLTATTVVVPLTTSL